METQQIKQAKLKKIKESLTPNVLRHYKIYKEEKKAISNLFLTHGGVYDGTPESARRSIDTYRKARKIAKRIFWQNIAVDLGKTAGAFAIYEVTARTYGVSAHDMELSFDAEKAWENTSTVSLAISAKIASMMPQDMQETVANAIIPIEVGLSIVRMYVEQKVWKSYGITPDSAGTLLTPYLAGTLELAYKATVNYPKDERTRITVGLVGIYGNFVRMFNAGIIAMTHKIARGNLKLFGGMNLKEVEEKQNRRTTLFSDLYRELMTSGEDIKSKIEATLKEFETPKNQ